MEKKFIYEGKTSSEAIEKGLKELNVSKKDVEIKILENEEKRTFFNILAPRIVKVELTLRENINNKEVEKNEENKPENFERFIDSEALEEATNNVKKFLNEFFEKTKSEKFDIEIKNDGKNTIIVNIDGQDANFMIGYRGETLNSLQTILVSVASKNVKEKIHVNVDILGYREKRKKVLEELAQRIANNVIKNKKSITLEPMPAYERKIIHSKLQDSEKIKTISIGEGEHRRVVISLK
jgi:spoIIIJ-associated protein